MSFKLTEKQEEGNKLLASPATNIMLFGGSRSGKTFLIVRAICVRAIKAPKSRHAIFRFRFNAVKNSIVLDTFPKVMELCFPDVEYGINKTDYYATFKNGSEIWFGGLDDKERTEKILGMEFVTIYINESSQVPYNSVEQAITRLAQKVMQLAIDHIKSKLLQPKMYFDCNPPPKSHWTYILFVKKLHPDTKMGLSKPDDYVALQMNPLHNAENLSEQYLDTLSSLSARSKKRFLLGEFADATPNQLFKDEDIDKWRVVDGNLPDMVRIVIAVDPSGSGDVDNADNDAIGIAAVGLGVDGNAYLMEDLTVKAGPATWGKVATDAYDRLMADLIVGETNYGGAMVKYTIQTCRERTPYKEVHASRGKAVRAEPISALYEQGKVRHVGYFHELEDELSAFSTLGYLGDKSPNRADAVIWALTELFSGIVNPRTKPKKTQPRKINRPGAWMN